MREPTPQSPLRPADDHSVHVGVTASFAEVESVRALIWI